MNDGVRHAFEDDKYFITEWQDLFGKRLYTHTNVENDETSQRGKLPDNRFVVGNLINQLHVARTVRGEQQLHAGSMLNQCLSHAVAGHLAQFTNTQEIHESLGAGHSDIERQSALSWQHLC